MGAALSKREVFDRLRYEPHAGQRRIHRSVKRMRVASCGRRFGKSVIGGHELTPEALLTYHRLNELEEKLHNPKAKVVYDVFGPRGGAMLYSQLTWLLNNYVDGDGPPTKAQTELDAELTKTLAGYSAEFTLLTTTELAKLNASALKSKLPELYVPPVKKK